MKQILFVSMIALSGCATLSEFQANFIVAKAPEQVANCDYIGAFKAHFENDGVPESLASPEERKQSVLEMRMVRAHGANTVLRVEPDRAPLAKVNAYRCLGWLGWSGQILAAWR